jgi:hypothetical protein
LILYLIDDLFRFGTYEDCHVGRIEFLLSLRFRISSPFQELFQLFDANLRKRLDGLACRESIIDESRFNLDSLHVGGDSGRSELLGPDSYRLIASVSS